MTILFISSNAANPNHYLARAAYDALKKNIGAGNAYWSEYSNAIQIALAVKPDALLVFDGQCANNSIIERLSAICPKRAIWFCEDPYELGVNLTASQYFDLVYTNDQASCQAYGEKGRHLPLAADMGNNFFPVKTDDLSYDIFFAGSAWPNRLRFINELQKRLPDLRWKLILVSNPNLDSHIKDIRGDFSFSKGVSIRDFSAIANRSAITLALPREFSTSESINASSQTPGPRLFEAALAGGCQVVDIRAMPLTNEMLPSKEAFIPFNNIDDCIPEIQKLLKNFTYRNSIATKAQLITKQQHLFDNRILSITNDLIDLPPSSSKQIQSTANLRQCLLFVSHNTINHGHFGGSEIYLDHLMKNMADEFECYLLSHDGREGFGKNYHLYNHRSELLETFKPSTPFHDSNLSHPEIESYFQKKIQQLGVDFVYFNHIIGFPPSLVRIAKAYGCTPMFVLHDYYLICDNFNLLNHQGRYCHITANTEDICNACTYKRRGMLPGSQARRRRFLGEISSDFDTLIAGSKISAEIVSDLFPKIAEKIVLRPPAVQKPKIQYQANVISQSRLQIALIGNFSTNKGADLALSIFKTMRNDPVDFHIIGGINEDYLQLITSEALPNVKLHGAYISGILPVIATQCRIGLILSNWPETYCMVLSELWHVGIVPVARSVGALGERITDGLDGIILKNDEPESIRCQLIKIAENPSLADSLKKNFPEKPCPDEKEYSQWLISLIKSKHTRKATPSRSQSKLNFNIMELGLYLKNTNWPIDRNISNITPKPVSWHKKIYRGGVAIKKSIKRYFAKS